MAKKNYQLEIIQQAIVTNDFKFDPEESITEVFQQAYDSLVENPVGHVFVCAELRGHGMRQGYTFCDDATDYANTVSGEIFDFGHYGKDNGVYFHQRRFRGNSIQTEEDFEPVAWYDIPNEGDEKRKEYIFVFDTQLMSDGKLAMLYDYFE